MKNYKILIPIVLVILFVYSFYTIWDINEKNEELYQQYIATAEDKRKQKVIGDTLLNYQKALELKPSKDLYLEIGDFYYEIGKMDSIEEWGEQIISAYPKDKVGYDFLMKLYWDNQDYLACFRIHDRAVNRGVKSEYIEKNIKEIENTYFLSGKYLDVGEFSENYCPVNIGGMWGYVNLSGRTVISPVFKEAGAFSGGVAPIVDKNDEAYYIDTAGRRKYVLLDVNGIKEYSMMYNQTYAVNNGKSYGFYNTAHQFLFGEYDYATSLGSGVAAVEQDGKWSLINMKGKEISENTYSEIIFDTRGVVVKNERIFAREDSEYIMLDMSGKQVSDKTFEAVDMFKDGNYAAVKENGKWSFIDKNGKTVLETEYEEVRSFSNGYAAVKENGVWGYINLNNQLIIEPTFEEAMDFNRFGCVFVKQDGMWTLLKLNKYNH